jgi:hypothetical protein
MREQSFQFSDTADQWWQPADGSPARPIVGWMVGKYGVYPMVVTRKGDSADTPGAEPGKIIRSFRGMVHVGPEFDEAELDRAAKANPGTLFFRGDVQGVSCG